MPVVENIGRRRVVLDQVRRIHLEVGREHIGPVKIRRSPRVPQVIGVGSGKKQADVALLIERVAPGVACAHLNVMRKPLLKMGFQSVVGGVSYRLPESRIGTETHIRCAEVRIAAVGRVPWLPRDRVVVITVAQRVLVENFKPVGCSFTPDWIAGSGDSRLVERDRNHRMPPAVAGVTDCDRHVVGRLPLHAQRVVHRVRQHVLLVVGAKIQRRRTVGVAFLVVETAATRTVIAGTGHVVELVLQRSRNGSRV